MKRWRSIGGGLGAALWIGAACSGDGGGSGSSGGGVPAASLCPEVFALGLRNPWRMNFDPATNDLYVGDVGENAQEEIDVIVRGGNYGWDCFEGTAPYENVPACNLETFIPPEASFGRTDARAITGGAVYRGSAIPSLVGFYVFGDFLTQRFFAFDVSVPAAAVVRLTLPPASVAAFGQGRDGEIYVVSFGSPSIQRIAGSGFSTLTLEPAFGSRAFASPVKLVQHPTIDDRWYVVEQDGLVRTFLASDTSGAITTAANVDAVVNLGTDNEQGLLGMAFDPNFAMSGEIYLTYTDEGLQDSVLARWVSVNAGLTFSSDAVVLSIDHPLGNHNGGDLAFGRDGFLYYSMGDGGGGGDPVRNAQNRNVLLGKILRLDVNAMPPPGKTYAIPATNPAAGNPQCDAG